ncbi:MAG: glutathione S-transferase family protein, partial [Pseudomonadota bacterium]
MGLLVEGKWQDKWYDTKSTGGKFVRKDSAIRNWVTADGEPGPSGVGGYKAESGRYHLYVSLACPWAHRTLIFRKLKGLEPHIDISIVHHFMGENGWTFKTEGPATGDKLFGSEFMHEVYTRAISDYTGRVTVPVLWDKKTNTAVSNESSEIIRMFNSAFNGLTGDTQEFYPEHLRAEIDAVNERIYHTVNNGVYKSGFATSTEAYEEAVTALFDSLDWLEERLSDQRYLMGDSLTEADWRLFTTLVRFDPVYVGHFKCNIRRISDYPNLWGYTRELYQMPGIAETFDIDYTKRHYYASHES